jgi:hypothetical protein
MQHSYNSPSFQSRQFQDINLGSLSLPLNVPPNIQNYLGAIVSTFIQNVQQSANMNPARMYLCNLVTNNNGNNQELQRMLNELLIDADLIRQRVGSQQEFESKLQEWIIRAAGHEANQCLVGNHPLMSAIPPDRLGDHERAFKAFLADRQGLRGHNSGFGNSWANQQQPAFSQNNSGFQQKNATSPWVSESSKQSGFSNNAGSFGFTSSWNNGSSNEVKNAESKTKAEEKSVAPDRFFPHEDMRHPYGFDPNLAQLTYEYRPSVNKLVACFPKEDMDKQLHLSSVNTGKSWATRPKIAQADERIAPILSEDRRRMNIVVIDSMIVVDSYAGVWRDLAYELTLARRNKPIIQAVRKEAVKTITTEAKYSLVELSKKLQKAQTHETLGKLLEAERLLHEDDIESTIAIGLMIDRFTQYLNRWFNEALTLPGLRISCYLQDHMDLYGILASEFDGGKPSVVCEKYDKVVPEMLKDVLKLADVETLRAMEFQDEDSVFLEEVCLYLIDVSSVELRLSLSDLRTFNALHETTCPIALKVFTAITEDVKSSGFSNHRIYVRTNDGVVYTVRESGFVSGTWLVGIEKY